jgi:hypothetical protein
MSADNFGDRYFPPRYFPDGQFGARNSAAPPAPTPSEGISGAYATGRAIGRRRKRRRDEDMKIVAAILAMEQKRIANRRRA